MNDLKKKILTLLISLLSTFLIILLIIFNLSIYKKEYNDIKEKFLVLESVNDKFKFNDADINPAFIENESYEVILNKFGNIEKIISYSTDTLSDDEIKTLINKNINKINSNKIGSLYTNNYLFFINRNSNILILNNVNCKKYLLTELLKSLITFIILETIIIISSIKITKWIVKPVDDAFIKQKQFIYDASHELKTPIAIISASAETLEKNPKEQKWLTNIKSETERMSRLVINLLDLSKSENIKEKEVFENINLSKIIQNKALSFESLIYENNLKLETDIEKDIYYKCNQDRIKELLSILMDNGIKHSKKESTIKVSLNKEKNNIILSVKNKGDEIPENEREKIFERFYRIDKSRNRDVGRYGLGLSIAKNIVINHNGNIKVICNDGYTTFKVTLKQK